MKQKTRIVALTTLLLIGLLAVAGVSKPGRTTARKLFSLLAPVAASPDVEQRARAKHGWNTRMTGAVVRGTITYYQDDLVQRQARLTLYYGFPNQLRVETEYQGIIEAWGYGSAGEWQLRAASLSAEEKRDIRGWLRLLPARLFVDRAANAGYRELGSRLEAGRPEAPGHRRADNQSWKGIEEVEVIDNIGAADRRAIYYTVDKDNAIVSSARWLEPDNPQDNVEDPNAPTKEVRVDFSNWRRFDGVLLPQQVTRWVAGKADFVI